MVHTTSYYEHYFTVSERLCFGLSVTQKFLQAQNLSVIRLDQQKFAELYLNRRYLDICRPNFDYNGMLALA